MIGFGYRRHPPYGYYDDEVRFLGLHDPVYQALYNSHADIAPLVNHSKVGFATNFFGTAPDQVSRWYWTRLPYANASDHQAFVATHSAFQGSPTYSTDGDHWGMGIPNEGHPSTWLEGLFDAADIAGSIAMDTWIRQQARANFVPTRMVDDYEFDSLWPAPNEHSPNHDPNFDWDGENPTN